jgi:tripartite-type tricarboxylate transporter receptor subunit TctC
MIGINRLSILFSVVVSALLMSAVPAVSQTWPQRSVKFVIPFGPGAGADIGARLFAERLSRIWGHPVVVENRPGGDGIVAVTAFVNANDDHTLLFAASGSFIIHPYQHEKLPYDVRDIAPIAQVSNTILVVGVNEALKIGSLDDLVRQARTKPGTLSSALVPGVVEFTFNSFLKTVGINIPKAPYRDIVQAGPDLAEGRIQVLMASLAVLQPPLQTGKVKLIAVTNRKRVSVLPDIPTASEAGYPSLELEGLVGLFGPRSMSSDLREKIATDVRAVAADPTVSQRLTATGQVPSAGTSAEFVKSIGDQRARANQIAQQLGMKAAQ